MRRSAAGVDDDHVNCGGVRSSQSTSTSRARPHWATRSLGRLIGTAILFSAVRVPSHEQGFGINCLMNELQSLPESISHLINNSPGLSRKSNVLPPFVWALKDSPNQSRIGAAASFGNCRKDCALTKLIISETVAAFRENSCGTRARCRPSPDGTSRLHRVCGWR